MKKTVKKEERKGGITIITPNIKVKTIKSPEKVEKVEYPTFGKYEVLTKVPLPEGHIRSIALKDYKGMEDDIYEGDILDLPERRFKTLSQRGLVKAYDGAMYPNKRR